MARSTAAEAYFIDIEARTLRMFDAIRRPFAIGHNGSDLDRVLHLRFEVAARRAVIPNYMHFLSQLEMWVGHRKSPPRGSQQRELRQLPDLGRRPFCDQRCTSGDRGFTIRPRHGAGDIPRVCVLVHHG